MTIFWLLLTVIIVVTAVVLRRRGSWDRSTKLLATAVFMLYALASAYWACGVYDLACALQLLVENVNSDPDDYGVYGVYGLGGAIIPSILFGLLMAIGDAVVWWRVHVLCRSSKRVTLCLACFFPFAVLVLGGVTAYFGVPPGLQSWYQPWGVAASGVSFLSNALATSLIAYKAWTHRMTVEDHLQSQTKGSTPTLRILFLLVESGLIYCILWGFVFSYQLYTYYAAFVSTAPIFNGASFIPFDNFFQGCLPMLVGMYPAIIIILATLQKRGGTHFTQQAASEVLPVAIPLRRLSVATEHECWSANTISESATEPAAAPRPSCSGTSVILIDDMDSDSQRTATDAKIEV